MFKNNVMTRHLIRIHLICKDIAIFHRKYQGANLKLQLWKRIFSDFLHFLGFRQAIRGIFIQKKYGKLYMSEQISSSSTR